MDLLQKAMRTADGDLAGRTYQAMGLVAGSLLHAGFPLAATGLLQLQCDITDKDDRAAELLAALSQAADVPLLLARCAAAGALPQRRAVERPF